MAFYEWSDDLCVNVAQIDNQHKRLVDLIDQLHDAMMVGKGKEISRKVLDELIDYTKTHFTDEEQLMERNAYPYLNVHKNEHKKFVDKVVSMGEDFTNGKIGLTMDIMKFLKDWLNDHIMVTDQKVGKYLNEHGVV